MDLSFHIPAWLAAILLQPLVRLLVLRLRVAWKLESRTRPQPVRRPHGQWGRCRRLMGWNRLHRPLSAHFVGVPGLCRDRHRRAGRFPRSAHRSNVWMMDYLQGE
jgi:hypothetical protein